MEHYHFLFVDDDPDEHDMLGDALNDLANNISISYELNGEDALVLLDQEFAAGKTPQLIILDLNMPKMNGTRTLQALKADARFQHIPVIIYSTSVNPVEQQRCIELGAHSYLTKPLSYSETVDIINVFVAVAALDKTL